ncbi:MAG: hypothetical protein L6V88_02580 [Anaerotruncus sp.]|nr:MAG: hypothetical protein L6V88_02580 [Anaerotruncus sp.]
MPGSGNGLGLDAKDYVVIAIGVVVIFIVGIINEKKAYPFVKRLPSFLSPLNSCSIWRRFL